MNLLKKFLQWYKDKHHINLDFHFTDNHSFNVIEVHSIQSGSPTEPSLNFGSFSWRPNLETVLMRKSDIEETITYIERQFTMVTGYELWTEVDILNQIRHVLKKGKSDTVTIVWGMFTRYHLNIHFSNEVKA